jgi:hypothetical protein
MIKFDLISGVAAALTTVIAKYFFGTFHGLAAICFVSITMTIFSITYTMIKNRR